MRIENENLARDRIGNLAMSVGVDWETQGWVMVRELAFDAEPVAGDSSEDVREGIILESFEFSRVERGIQVGTNSECTRLEKKMEKIGMWSLSGRENVDKKKRMIMKMKIYKLYCKLLKSHCLFLKHLIIYLCFGVIGWINFDGIMSKVYL